MWCQFEVLHSGGKSCGVQTGYCNEYACITAYNGEYFRVSTGLTGCIGDSALLVRGGASFIR